MEGEICRQSGRAVDLPSGVILRPEASRSMVLLGNPSDHSDNPAEGFAPESKPLCMTS